MCWGSGGGSGRAETLGLSVLGSGVAAEKRRPPRPDVLGVWESSIGVGATWLVFGVYCGAESWDGGSWWGEG